MNGLGVAGKTRARFRLADKHLPGSSRAETIASTRPMGLPLSRALGAVAVLSKRTSRSPAHRDKLERSHRGHQPARGLIFVVPATHLCSSARTERQRVIRAIILVVIYDLLMRHTLIVNAEFEKRPAPVAVSDRASIFDYLGTVQPRVH